MKTAEIRTLVDYNEWATERVLDAVEKAGQERFLAVPDAHTASLQQTLVHVLYAEQLWRTRLETGTSSTPLQTEDFPGVDVLRRAWAEEQRAMRAYFVTLDDDALDSPIQFQRSSGELSVTFVRWHLPVQMVLHGAQHRSEAAALLTAYGHSPGNLDFIFFVLGHR